jgi:hypothetical protein
VDSVAQELNSASDRGIGYVPLRISGAICERMAQVVLGRWFADILSYTAVINGELTSE